MAQNSVTQDDLKRLFEFIVRFDRIDGSNQLSFDQMEKFNATINSMGQTKLVNALHEVSIFESAGVHANPRISLRPEFCTYLYFN